MQHRDSKQSSDSQSGVRFEDLAYPAAERSSGVVIEGLQAATLWPEDYKIEFSNSGSHPLLPRTISWWETSADEKGQPVRSTRSWVGLVFSREDFREDCLSATNTELKGHKIPPANLVVRGPKGGLLEAALTNVDNLSPEDQSHGIELFSPGMYNAQLHEALQKSRFVVWTRQGWGSISIGERVIDRRAPETGLFLHTAKGELRRIESERCDAQNHLELCETTRQAAIERHAELLRRVELREEAPNRRSKTFKEGDLVMHASSNKQSERSWGLCLIHDWGWKIEKTETQGPSLGPEPGSPVLEKRDLKLIGKISDIEHLAHQRGCSGYTVSPVASNPNLLRIRLGSHQPFYLPISGSCAATREEGKLAALRSFELEVERAVGQPVKLWRLDGTADDKSWETFRGIAADPDGHLGIVLSYEKYLFTDGSRRPVWEGRHLGNRGRRFFSTWITEDPRAVCHGKHFAEHM